MTLLSGPSTLEFNTGGSLCRNASISVGSDFIALCATQLPNHPSGTSSERTVAPEDRDLAWCQSMIGDKGRILYQQGACNGV
jgi:hypothetical protein